MSNVAFLRLEAGGFEDILYFTLKPLRRNCDVQQKGHFRVERFCCTSQFSRSRFEALGFEDISKDFLDFSSVEAVSKKSTTYNRRIL